MNTIAAQFPELPTPSAVLERTWRATWFVGEYKLDHGIEQHEVYTADQMHQYARDYAAMLAAAPSAASVSERARELLAAQFTQNDTRREALLLGRNVGDPAIRRALRAIEQALTQQRGECEASVSVKQKWPKRHQFPKPDEHGNETGSIGEHAYAEGWNACLDEAKRMSGVPMPLKGKKGVVVVEDTTPQPSADAVREYVTELRAQADQKMGVAGACAHDGDRARYKSAAQLLRRVADELESLLSAASGEGVGK